MNAHQRRVQARRLARIITGRSPGDRVNDVLLPPPTRSFQLLASHLLPVQIKDLLTNHGFNFRAYDNSLWRVVDDLGYGHNNLLSCRIPQTRHYVWQESVWCYGVWPSYIVYTSGTYDYLPKHDLVLGQMLGLQSSMFDALMRTACSFRAVEGRQLHTPDEIHDYRGKI